MFRDVYMLLLNVVTFGIQFHLGENLVTFGTKLAAEKNLVTSGAGSTSYPNRLIQIWEYLIWMKI